MNLRLPVLVFAGVFAATLVLTACDAVDGTGPTSNNVDEADAPALGWTTLTSDRGAGMVLVDRDNTPIFDLSCLPTAREMQAMAHDFTVIGSEERMTLGIDNDAWGFVADTQRAGEGVMGRTAIDPAMLDALSRTQDLSVLYGTQQGGPWPAPPQDQREAFIQACAQIAGLSGAEGLT